MEWCLSVFDVFAASAVPLPIGHYADRHPVPLGTPPRWPGPHAIKIAQVEWAQGPRVSYLDEYWISKRKTFWLLWNRVRPDDFSIPYWELVAWCEAAKQNEISASAWLIYSFWFYAAEIETRDMFSWVESSDLLNADQLERIGALVWRVQTVKKKHVECLQCKIEHGAHLEAGGGLGSCAAPMLLPREQPRLSATEKWLKTVKGAASANPRVEAGPVPDELKVAPASGVGRPYGSKAMLDAAAAKRRLAGCAIGAWLISPMTGWKWAVYEGNAVGWVPDAVQLPPSWQVSDGTTDEESGAA